LKGSRKPVETRKGDSRAPTKPKPSAIRRKLRALERFKAQFHSQERARFVQGLPCVACGATPSENHHEPHRGNGGKYEDISPLCKPCHQKRHNTGAKTFWTRIGKSYVETNAATQKAWLRHLTGSMPTEDK